ncbi:MAG TPA: HD domain-containing protein [Polyangiaceae bacterium]|jgi:tRNA nucleotidyltransferase (CCA-adding enzyme)|nr:HD domain-containing protein [Polyangiaceae bacterium]
MDRADLAKAPRDVTELCERLRSRGKRAWIVGGCVRDLMMGRAAADWDVATDARPNELMAIFPRAIPTGIEHGTVTVVQHGHHYEVTTLRGDGTYSDGRRPDKVEFVDDITADLARRDFTVNAMAIDPLDGKVIDPFDGVGDLGRRLLRAVGNPLERFAEDGLRVLRAARFVATLELDLDPGTRAAIRPTLDTYRKVAMERVRDEWVKAMKARAPSRAFEVMRETGILEVTCPELLDGVGLDQNKFHAYDVWRHGMECMDACAADPVLRIAALLHDVGKPKTRAWSDKTHDYTFYDHERVGAEIADPIAARLRFSNDERLRIVSLVRHHLFHYSDEWTDAAVRRWIRRVGPERVADLYVLNEADVRAKGKDCTPDLAALAALKVHVARVLEQGAALSTRDLKINGHDLIRDAGVRPGRAIGQILDALLEAVTADPALNEREALLALAREWLKAQGN